MIRKLTFFTSYWLAFVMSPIINRAVETATGTMDTQSCISEYLLLLMYAHKKCVFIKQHRKLDGNKWIYWIHSVNWTLVGVWNRVDLKSQSMEATIIITTKLNTAMKWMNKCAQRSNRKYKQAKETIYMCIYYKFLFKYNDWNWLFDGNFVGQTNDRNKRKVRNMLKNSSSQTTWFVDTARWEMTNVSNYILRFNSY